MDYSILYGEYSPVVECHLKKGELIRAESDAMLAMDTNIDIRGKMRGGLLGGLARMFLTDESFFLQEMVAARGDGKVLFAPQLPGGIIDVELDGSYGLAVKKCGFLAATEHVVVGTKMENLVRGFFSGTGLFVLKLSGNGTVFVNAWGAIHPLILAENEEIIIDNGHLVAWPEFMEYHIEKAASSWLSSITSGENLVCRFKGPGTVLIQTRNFPSFMDLIQTISKKAWSSSSSS